MPPVALVHVWAWHRASAEVFCQPTSSGSVDGFASWPITATSASDVTVTVTSCIETYVGNPTRQCRSDGTWGPVTDPCVGACYSTHRERSHSRPRSLCALPPLAITP